MRGFSKTSDSQFFSIARHGRVMINSPPIQVDQMTSAITEQPVAEQKLVRGLGWNFYCFVDHCATGRFAGMVTRCLDRHRFANADGCAVVR